jgi:hypothetical protein
MDASWRSGHMAHIQGQGQAQLAMREAMGCHRGAGQGCGLSWVEQA